MTWQPVPGDPVATWRETAWLIERGQAQNHKPTVWWAGEAMTQNAWEAVRYATKAEAEEVIAKHFSFRYKPTADAVEHGFLEEPERVTVKRERLESAEAVCRAAKTWWSLADAPVTSAAVDKAGEAVTAALARWEKTRDE